MRRRARSPRPAAAVPVMLSVLAATVAIPLAAGDIEVVDGDSLVVRGAPVRLLGIEAPEQSASCERDGRIYACGLEAARVLKQLVTGAQVHCEGLEGPRFGEEIVASCSADGRDLGRALVRRGWARADRRYASRYEYDEEQARAEGRGLWAGTPPWK